LALLAVLPAYTMASRLYVGAHHVSDVLSAFAYASVWLVICSRLLLPRREGPAHSV
jgi:membrane-associated phospholipid phosphatase